ncbi:triose-phosphate isomerase [Mycoavidus sp. B2-EB]|uniref:triose-phosphate isomerase n=1 Tax=Mycoavidus sp. B2-EB TaxID=2651972 RepID=UPI00162879AF|nr:triose-phosphate isomerase [Mycoavidus sp. B2-EB]BBO60003.1 triosephosphate isomerase [Mycoavidus sp. B2-EB]
MELLESKNKLIVGNWKMHGRLAGNALLFNALAAGAAKLDASVRTAVCVPFPYLAQAQTLLQQSCVTWGAQDLSLHLSGAYTGEVAGSMVAEFGARWVIVGHSERRLYHQESNQHVVLKAKRALEVGLTPIICVGETLAEREAGQTEQVLGQQLQAVLTALTVAQAERMVLAYEPVWAIGTGKSASVQEVSSVHLFLRRVLAAVDAKLAHVTVLYGGSMKPDNARALLAEPGVDGGLVGGASLQAEDFFAICKAAQA